MLTLGGNAPSWTVTEVSMRRIAIVTLMMLGLAATAALASDPTGVYAVVDKVVLEPTPDAPQRVQVWGTFVLASGRGSTYGPPERGYMYFSALPGKEDVCRREW